MEAVQPPPRAPVSYTATFETIDDVLKQATEAHGTVIVYLFAERDAVSNISWCPDCRRSDDYLRSAFARAQKEGLQVPAFVDASVGPREGYKNTPTHPYRQHPQIAVKCVPTLLKWTKSGPTDRLEEPADEASVWSFLFPK